jgi:ribosomal protein S18 acetylase RimI-like enzyme
MQWKLKFFNDLDIYDLYDLLKNIYSASGTMSESFDEKFPHEAACRNYFQELSSLPGAIAVFAEAEGQLAGFLTIRPRHQANIRHTAELNMGVHSGFRGRGIGKYLMQEALMKAENTATIEIIYLMVREDNIPAIRLYTHFGFEKLAILEKDTKIEDIYYNGILMRRFVHSSHTR